MIPAFTASGLLPAGIHVATWDEVEGAYGSNAHRQRLLAGLYEVLLQLKIAGCRRAYVNGSFVTSEPKPGDYDVCWDTMGVDPVLLDPVFLDVRPPRTAQKAKYFGEFFPSSSPAATGYTFLQYFQQDKNTGDLKGIVAINLLDFKIKT